MHQELELFTPGQTVTWGDLDEIMRSVVEDAGPGPFIVLTTEDISNQCSCGGSLDDETHQMYFGCPYKSSGYGRVSDDTGHPQQVTIADSAGKPITSMLLGKEKPTVFSGLFFRSM